MRRIVVAGIRARDLLILDLLTPVEADGAGWMAALRGAHRVLGRAVRRAAERTLAGLIRDTVQVPGMVRGRVREEAGRSLAIVRSSKRRKDKGLMAAEVAVRLRSSRSG